VSAGTDGALQRLRLLHKAIVDREEQGESLSRLLPSGLAAKLRESALRIGETERVNVTVLMSDIRAYSTIAEHADPSQLAGQLNTHRAAMNKAILGEGGTVMQFVGDAVMAVFGAPFPQPDHADRAVAAAAGMHALQAEINAAWIDAGLLEFGPGLGLSTGEAAAALLGSAQRLEYTLVGDTVNLSQRLQQFASAGETVISAATKIALTSAVALTALPAQLVKGRDTPVLSFKIDPDGTAGSPEDNAAQEPAQAQAAEAAPPARAAPAAQTPPACAPPALRTEAETTESRLAPAEASRKAEGNRKWKLWKSRNVTR
jgi:class 3 adenylate cyclase